MGTSAATASRQTSRPRSGAASSAAERSAARRAAAAKSGAKPKPRRKPSAKRAKQPSALARLADALRIPREALWIGLITVLLAGVVFLNVTVLRETVKLEQLGRERSELRTEIAHLEAQISRKAAADAYRKRTKQSAATETP